jgi:hypothetical protein
MIRRLTVTKNTDRSGGGYPNTDNTLTDRQTLRQPDIKIKKTYRIK